jgi:hypothetical protein
LRVTGWQPSGRVGRIARVAMVVAIPILLTPQLACAVHQRSAGPGSAVACEKTRYLLSVRPRTTVSNERHRLSITAASHACGRRAAVRHALVDLGRYRATTDGHGRATLTVRLPTGLYLIRLYVHRRVVARTPVDAIPIV